MEPNRKYATKTWPELATQCQIILPPLVLHLQLLLPNTAENERQELHSEWLIDEKKVFPNLV